MPALNWDRLEAARVRHDPFEHLLVGDALSPTAAAGIPREFPRINKPGSFSLRDAPPGPILRQVVEELESERFRSLMSRQFGVDLSRRATMVTLRGECGVRDGFIHTDSKSKVLSVLLYLNEDWLDPDGQLRLLRNAWDLDSAAVEVAPSMGALLAFLRSDRSWHGHTPYVGPRRVLQFNYVRSETTHRVGDLRHRLSALLKWPTAA
jgi:hypothetical protein